MQKMNDVFINTMTIDGAPIMRIFPLIVEEHELNWWFKIILQFLGHLRDIK
jgi:hypothetical protein